MRPQRLACLGLALALAACTVGTRPAPPPTGEAKGPTTLLRIVAALRAELIPPIDSATGYGPTFNLAGYEEIVDWNRLIVPSEPWLDEYEAVDILLPCCQAVHPNRDETLNCGCGHHQALYGAAKGLLARGYDGQRAQIEIDRWKAFFFPEARLLAELERRALTDPDYQEALRQFKTQGVC